MIGDKYWATGISVRTMNDRDDALMWAAEMKFLDDGFCDDDADNGQISTEGKLHTRYLVRDGDDRTALATILDVLIADAATLGITFRTDIPPSLYFHQDGVDPDWPPPPGWENLLAEQADRLGWTTNYSPTRRRPMADDKTLTSGESSSSTHLDPSIGIDQVADDAQNHTSQEGHHDITDDKPTSGGVELTDDLLDRLAEEAEQGYEVDNLRPRTRRGRPPHGAEAATPSQYTIVQATQTCSAAPSQWDAWTDTGQYLYLRYRHGVGTVNAFDSPDPSRWPRTPPEILFHHGHPLDGYITLTEFAEHAGLTLNLDADPAPKDAM